MLLHQKTSLMMTFLTLRNQNTNLIYFHLTLSLQIIPQFISQINLIALNDNSVTNFKFLKNSQKNAPYNYTFNLIVNYISFQMPSFNIN